MIAPRVAPMVRRMAMSALLSFTSMIRPEMMFSAATSTISIRMRNMTLRSTSSTPKNVLFRWRQSDMIIGRLSTSPCSAFTASIRSGRDRKTSMAVTSLSRLK